MVLARDRTRVRRWLAVALVEVTAVVLASGTALVVSMMDTGGGSAATPARPALTPESIELPNQPGATAPVILPGRPGESAQVVRPDQVSPPAGPRYNAADVRFVTMMIPHHVQALQLAELVPDRAGSPQVIALAERIGARQQPEVKVLDAWLQARKLDRSPDQGSGRDHRTMPGMQSAKAIATLTATTGTAFDRMYVEMMTAHHQGAIEMAQEVLVTGLDQQVGELARNIAFEQAVEINRMRDILADQPR